MPTENRTTLTPDTPVRYLKGCLLYTSLELRLLVQYPLLETYS